MKAYSKQQSTRETADLIRLDDFDSTVSTSELKSSSLETDELSAFISQDILAEDHAITRNYTIAKIITAIFASTAGVPSVQPAMEAAGKNTVLGVFFATGCVISFGAGAIWIFHKIIDDLKPKSEAEQELLSYNKRKNCYKSILTHLLSAITTIIPVYTAFKYNDVKALIVITIPISYAFNVYGFNRVLDIISASLSCGKTRLASEFQLKQQKLSEHIHYRVIPSLMVMSLTELKELDRQLLLTIDNKQFMASLTSMREKTSFKKLPTQYFNGYVRKLFQAIGLIFPSLTAILNFLLAREAGMKVTNDQYIATILALIITTPALTIDSIVTLSVFGNIFDIMINFINKNPKQHLLPAKYPKVSVLLYLSALTLAALSSSNKAYVAYTTASSSLRDLLTASSIASSILFELLALTDQYYGLYNEATQQCGNNKDKIVVKVQTKLLKFDDTIMQADPKKYGGFFITHQQSLDQLSNLAAFDQKDSQEEEKQSLLSTTTASEQATSPATTRSFFFRLLSSDTNAAKNRRQNKRSCCSCVVS